ncbi:MAG: class I SAM-dependent methyltransferase [Campylobacteraceae bacterium]|nr:class I SAM-dependent methyltransferase [Campylobacteraceae bacterium]
MEKKPVRDNVRFPKGDGGIETLKRMNKEHNKGSLWAICKLDLSKSANLNILDIGCGGGQNLINLANVFKNSTLWGIDYSPTSIELSSKTCDELIKNERLSLKVADVHDTKFKSGKFDLITAFETMYFWENLEVAFTEIKRILKTDGVFMAFLEGTKKETLEKWSAGVFLQNKLSPSEYKVIFKKAGFKNLEIYTKDESEITCFIARS